MQRRSVTSESRSFLTGTYGIKKLGKGTPKFQSMAGRNPHSIVSRLLSIIGSLNGAIWLGTNTFMFFTVAAFFRSEWTIASLGPIWSETLLVKLYKSYFVMNVTCAIVALAHQAGEWVYLAKHLTRRSTFLILICVFIALLGSLVIYPSFVTTRMAANDEAIQAAQSNTEIVSSSDSQTKYYQFWKGIVGMTHVFFMITSSLWVVRLAKGPSGSRPYLF
jgi:hypothetical protein